MKKRPRPVLRRPIVHHVIIGAYIIAPFVNVLLLRVFIHLPLPALVARLWTGLGPLATIWLLSAPLVGVALYFVSRVSWYVFLAHSTLVLVDVVLKLATSPQVYLRTVNGAHLLLILAGNVALLAVIGFILQRDFRAPYLQVLARSWRERRRLPIRHAVLLDGRRALAEDLSTLGCFVKDPGSSRSVGDRVSIAFEGEVLRIACSGLIMRITEGGLGIRFIRLPRPQKRDIARLLRRRFALRHVVDLDATWDAEGRQRAARILNISQGGCALEVNSDAMHGAVEGRLTVRAPGGAVLGSADAAVAWVSAGGSTVRAGLCFRRRQRRLSRLVVRLYGKGALIR
jgi:hypothetical protein